jgi:hypothetical protein
MEKKDESKFIKLFVRTFKYRDAEEPFSSYFGNECKIFKSSKDAGYYTMNMLDTLDKGIEVKSEGYVVDLDLSYIFGSE